MRDQLKNVYNWLDKLYKTLVSLFLILSINRVKTARLVRKLYTKGEGKACSILANGPSASEIIKDRADLLENTDLLVLNFYANQSEFFRLKPQYYIILDPLFFTDKKLNKGLNEKKADNYKIQKNQLIENLMKVDWSMTLFIPSNKMARRMHSVFAENPNIEVIHYNATRITGFTKIQNFLYGRGHGLPSSRNVIIPAMILMVLLGYEKIYLYGCEFSWTKTMDVDPDNGHLFFNDHHSYSKDEIRYFGKGAYLWWLKVIVEDLEATERVAEFANSKGVKIINRTKGSFIDAFEYENPDCLDNEVEKNK